MGIYIDILEKFIIPLVAQRVMPKVEELIDHGVLKVEKLHHDLYKNRFEEYLLRRYESFLTIDTLVLQNQQVPFHSLYLPLTLQSREKGKSVQYKIDKFDKNFIPEYFRVLVVDSAGMGKSTVLKKIFLSAIEENVSIPIFIELRKLNKDNSIINEIFNQLNPIHKKLSKDFILSLIRRGDFLFLFDGFDEIPIEDKDNVIKDLHEFIEKASGNYFVISSRPEDSLTSFSDFKKFNIKPLEKEEAYDLIRLYAQNEYKSNSEDLIRILEEKNNRSVHEFLTNPLLVSLLYAAFDHGKEVPLEKAQFYSLVYDALYHRHDLTKEGYFKRQKLSGLHRDNFEKILRGIGYASFREGRIEFRKTAILDFIARAKRFYRIEFAPSDFFEDIIRSVPLFQKDGNFYKWSHKSLQDYFTTRFLIMDTGDEKKNTFLGLFKSKESSKYENIFELAFYLDYKLFRTSIIYSFLKDFVEKADSYLHEKSKDIEVHKKIFGITYIDSITQINYSIVVLAYQSGKYPQILKDDFQNHMYHSFYMGNIDGASSVENVHGVSFEIYSDSHLKFDHSVPSNIFNLITSKEKELLMQVDFKENYRSFSKDFCEWLIEKIISDKIGYIAFGNFGSIPSWLPDEFANDYLTLIKGIGVRGLDYDYCSKLVKKIEEEFEEEKGRKDFL